MSRPRASHPDRLPWFALGRLNRAEAAAIEHHLDSCDACRSEVAALRSMSETLRPVTCPEPIAADRLAAYHDDAGRLPEHERARIERHLGACPECSLDLAILERAAESSPARRRALVLRMAASVAIVVTLAGGWALRGPDDPVPPEVSRVVVPAVQRGAGAVPLATGPGPWLFEVWLPLRAAPATYRVRVARSDDPGRALFGTTVEFADGDGSLRVPIPAGLRPGRHELVLTRAGEHGREDDVRGFDVVPAP